ncbi:MGC82682 protein [Xenopus laevis]|uniref:Pentraxin family member n=1 Tax=Xenopus laevis TaxID=8355 RepID=Q6GPQ8_XENLA|nr:C-reactive protein [Xenopus laevis]AAH73053.1 MGC82682 protein [Xenopus laevis]
MPGYLMQEDMNGKVFLFPEESNSSYVKLLPEKSGPYKALSVCLRYYSWLYRGFTLFSLATSDINNDFHLFYSPRHYFRVSVGNEDLIYIGIQHATWISICASWDSSSGVVELWMEGTPYPRKIFQKGHIISKDPSIIIGQEQLLHGNYFNITQSFVGEISDIHMWDTALTFKNISDVLQYNNLTGNVISWSSLNYKAEGRIAVLPCLKSMYPISTCN